MKTFYLSILMALALLPAYAQRKYNAMRETKKEFFKTEQARQIIFIRIFPPLFYGF